MKVSPRNKSHVQTLAVSKEITRHAWDCCWSYDANLHSSKLNFVKQSHFGKEISCDVPYDMVTKTNVPHLLSKRKFSASCIQIYLFSGKTLISIDIMIIFCCYFETLTFEFI